jgi:AraC-like DNA-binding protein
VLAQRLALAHRKAGDPRNSSEKISAIAFDSGFGDVSYSIGRFAAITAWRRWTRVQALGNS